MVALALSCTHVSKHERSNSFQTRRRPTLRYTLHYATCHARGTAICIWTVPGDFGPLQYSYDSYCTAVLLDPDTLIVLWAAVASGFWTYYGRVGVRGATIHHHHHRTLGTCFGNIYLQLATSVPFTRYGSQFFCVDLTVRNNNNNNEQQQPQQPHQQSVVFPGSTV